MIISLQRTSARGVCSPVDGPSSSALHYVKLQLVASQNRFVLLCPQLSYLSRRYLNTLFELYSLCVLENYNPGTPLCLVYSQTFGMSFLFGGRPQQSSAEKIAAAESEIEMISDMFNR